MKSTNPALAALVLVCFALLPTARAVSPAPDGGYPGGNTAEGQNALFSLTNGGYNTAIGYLSLKSDENGLFNTAVGAAALFYNAGGGDFGAGNNNTATGAGALLSNSTGSVNTAAGAFALSSNVGGCGNTAYGFHALYANHGTDCGFTGSYNTAVGEQALLNNTFGNFNTALGSSAGSNVTTANNVICIGSPGNNVDNSCYIGNIFNATSSGGTAVVVNSNGRLGTSTSSRRFKEEIKPLDKASEAVLLLKPVTFRYKKGVDPEGNGKSQYGLVAEDVEKVNPNLVVLDKEGKPYSVRYDQVNAMLLNEFLKEHKKVEKLEATVAQQQKSFETKLAEQHEQIKTLISGLQKVSAQLELNKPAPRTVLNNP